MWHWMHRVLGGSREIRCEVSGLRSRGPVSSRPDATVQPMEGEGVLAWGPLEQGEMGMVKTRMATEVSALESDCLGSDSNHGELYTLSGP